MSSGRPEHFNTSNGFLILANPDRFSHISKRWCFRAKLPPMKLEPNNVVAAFDLDGTLTKGGSVFKWLRYVAGSVATFRSTLWRSGPIAWGALRSGNAADRAKESLFHAVLAGRKKNDVEELSRTFADEHLSNRVRPDVLDRLQWHLKNGHHVVIVSASPEMYVQKIAGQLGVHSAIGTKLATDPLDRLTGGYLGKNCRGEEKLRRLNLWIDQLDLPGDSTIFAYGNSRGDRRMLSAATVAVDVGRLGRFGALRGFQRLSSLNTP